MKKVILISIDGMRPDGFLKCGNPFINTLMEVSTYTLEGRTVVPSLTLPCHVSMFNGINPQKHGTFSNVYKQQTEPVMGMMEFLKENGKCNAMYYSWEQLRDISRPGSVKFMRFLDVKQPLDVDDLLTDMALQDVGQYEPDFIFLYLGETDDKGGHGYGWMSEEYLGFINRAIDNVRRVYECLGDRYELIITADHGGHDFTHGTEMDEDMKIPMFFLGGSFKKGEQKTDISLLDIAPTVAKLFGVAPVSEWEGKSII